MHARRKRSAQRAEGERRRRRGLAPGAVARKTRLVAVERHAQQRERLADDLRHVAVDQPEHALGERGLGALERDATRLGGDQLDAASIVRDRRAAQHAPPLEAVHQRGQRRPAHAHARREIARAPRLLRDRVEQPVLGQADAGGLTGLFGDAGEACQQPDPRPEIGVMTGLSRRGHHRLALQSSFLVLFSNYLRARRCG